MRAVLGVSIVGLVASLGLASAASAKSCTELRSLCWTMRSDKSDCTKPYQRCLVTGIFITPLGRRFEATSRD